MPESVSGLPFIVRDMDRFQKSILLYLTNYKNSLKYNKGKLKRDKYAERGLFYVALRWIVVAIGDDIHSLLMKTVAICTSNVENSKSPQGREPVSVPSLYDSPYLTSSLQAVWIFCFAKILFLFHLAFILPNAGIVFIFNR